MLSDNMKTKNNFIYLFLLIFIISIFSIEVDAVSVTQLQTNTLTNIRGTAMLSFDNTGTRLFAIDSFHGIKPNWLSVYQLNNPYNISSLTQILTINLTTLFPINFSNYSISSAYLTRNGQHLYIVVSNVSNDQNDFSTPHINNYGFLHYTLNAFDFNTLNFSDWNQLQLTGVQPTSPRICGVYVTDDGHYFTWGGRYNINVGNPPDRPLISNYNMSAGYYSVYALGLNAIPGYTFSSSVTSFGAYCNIWVSSDNLLTAYIDNDIVNNAKHLYINTTAVLSDNYEGFTIIILTTNNYLFTQKAGTLYKYQINGLNISGGFISETPISTANAQAFLTNFINPLLSIFPNSATLSFSQRWAIVLVIMLLTGIILLFASSRISSDGIHRFMLFIIGGILFVEFIFFCAIKYIDTGIWIALIIISLAILLLRVLGGKR